MAVIPGDRIIARRTPLNKTYHIVAASLDVECSVCIAPDGNISFTVAVIIVLDGLVGAGYAERAAYQSAVSAFPDKPGQISRRVCAVANNC